ncbi:uncharacterized protein HKBW3S44_01410 [Candidatus Hakubella thermalkaliphila]|uniref:HEPN domain-containing protein n=1 Tax=Candidatus Hakubella thermalkaliphila TaxID=2754717 RepID=A0A6V8PZT8_9ACTN|nr:uncharacterized protein HKBW3S44_01410 [Candidatus Hakubella thermalkaliphila]
MKEIRDFIEKAEKFLTTAEHALDIGDYDSCVSRSYYAMLFLAEAVLLTKGLTASSHKGVISLFGEHFVKTGDTGHDDNIISGEEGICGGVPQFFYLGVDGGILLDVGVGLGDIGLRLIVIVVAHKVFHSISREKLLKLITELSSQDFVGGHHQSRFLVALNNHSHGVGLA